MTLFLCCSNHFIALFSAVAHGICSIFNTHRHLRSEDEVLQTVLSFCIHSEEYNMRKSYQQYLREVTAYQGILDSTTVSTLTGSGGSRGGMHNRDASVASLLAPLPVFHSDFRTSGTSNDDSPTLLKIDRSFSDSMEELIYPKGSATLLAGPDRVIFKELPPLLARSLRVFDVDVHFVSSIAYDDAVLVCDVIVDLDRMHAYNSPISIFSVMHAEYFSHRS
jgi:hypothetical protein